MTDDDFDLLRRRVTGFRNAIERSKIEYEYVAEAGRIPTWPRNCCDSPLFMIFLDECGYDPVIRHVGDVTHYGQEFANRHHWYEIDGVLVDVTADQFPDVSENVIVARHSHWHASLTPTRDSPMKLTVRQFLHRLRDRKIGAYDLDFERAIRPYLEVL